MKRKPMQSRLGIASQKEVITWNYFRSISQDRMLMLRKRKILLRCP